MTIYDLSDKMQKMVSKFLGFYVSGCCQDAKELTIYDLSDKMQKIVFKFLGF